MDFSWINKPIELTILNLVIAILVPQIVLNFLSRVPIPPIINFRFLGAKKFQKFKGVRVHKESSYEINSLNEKTIQGSLFCIYNISRKYFLINENVQSFLYQNSFKLSTQYNMDDFFEDC